jgi:hypothetical protein
MACFVAPAQRLVVFSLDFNLLRLIVLFGWARVLLRKETTHFRWNTLDACMLAFTVATTGLYTLQYGSVSAFVNRLGASFDAVGMYFLFRMLVRSFDDLRQAVMWSVIAAVPVALAFVIESQTGRNLFAFLGGVPAITLVRNGRLRCQGAFAHPVLAGCFWASLMPLIASLWWQRGQWRIAAVGGLFLSLLIIVLSASSTPVLALLAGTTGMTAYLLRQHVRLIRWSVVFVLMGLHIVMQAPVWHLISRVSAVGGSTGWHRFHLIDNFIRRWDEWALLGTMSTAHWGAGLEDVTNQYVLEGVRGGMLSLVLFVTAITIAFARVGRLWRAAPDGTERLFAWALGVSLFVHCVNFIGVSYFGQITMLWYLCLAAIGSMEAPRPARRPVLAKRRRATAEPSTIAPATALAS